LLGLTVNEPGAELAQHRGIETGIGQFEAEDVFPIDPTAHAVRSRAIGKAFGELEDSDEGEPPRGAGGLAMRGEERGKRLVGEEGAEFICEAEIGMALGERCMGDAGSPQERGRWAADGAWRSSLTSGDSWGGKPISTLLNFASSIILGAAKSTNSASEAREMPLQIVMRNCANVRLGFPWWQKFIGQAWCTENDTAGEVVGSAYGRSRRVGRWSHFMPIWRSFGLRQQYRE